MQEIFDQYRYYVPFYQRLVVQTADELQGLGIAWVNYVKYFLGTASYPLKSLNQEDFALYRSIENVTGPPSVYYFDRFNDNIEVYPSPNNSPPNSKFEIGYVPLDLISVLNQPIPTSWPLFAQKFFRYQLAKEICHVYKHNWLFEQDLKEARQIMIENSDNEMAIAKTPEWKETSDTPPISLLFFQSGGPFG